MNEIIKALNFSPMATSIILALLGIIVFFLGLFYKMVKDKINEVIKTRTKEIAVVKTSLETITDEIDKIKDKIDKNISTTTLLAYHQCMNEAMNWKNKGEIPVGAKIHFDRVWGAYKSLGDGHGDDPKKIIDALPIVN